MTCLRCNSCGSLFDDDLNILLQRNGPLICDDCLYGCSVCDIKIEDLAILARDDMGYCAIRFKCRKCKRKIENLEYARTSQGIFCKECHESLGQRRRRRARKAWAKNNQQEQTLANAPRNVQPGIDERLSVLKQPETPGLRDTASRNVTLSSAPKDLITPTEAPYDFF